MSRKANNDLGMHNDSLWKVFLFQAENHCWRRWWGWYSITRLSFLLHSLRLFLLLVRSTDIISIDEMKKKKKKKKKENNHLTPLPCTHRKASLTSPDHHHHRLLLDYFSSDSIGWACVKDTPLRFESKGVTLSNTMTKRERGREDISLRKSIINIFLLAVH